MKYRTQDTTQPQAVSDSGKGAVIYVRVSDERQAETDTDGGYSLAVQKSECRKIAFQQGAAFTEIFEEAGRSGTGRKRPQLTEALDRATQDDIGWFVVHKASRLARNARDALNIEFELAQAGVKLVAATESWDESPMGQLVKLLQFGFDETYSKRLSSDVRNKMEEKVRRGGTPYVAPQGYLNVRKNIDGIANVARIEVDPERAEHITWAFKVFAEGNHTVRTLLEELTQRGFTSRPTRKYPARPISTTRLAKLLRNPYYIGLVPWKGNLYPGEHQPLTDTATFEKVQSVLDGNNTGGNKSWRYDHYLNGSLFCGYCGDRMGFTHGRGNGGTYEYYFCRSKNKPDVANCPQRYAPVHLLEGALERHYNVVLQEVQRRLPKLKAAFDDLLSSHEANIERERQRFASRKQQLEREQRKLLQLAYDDAMPDELVREEMMRISADMERTEAAIVATAVDLGEVSTRFKQLCALIETAPETYQQAPDQKRRVLNQFFFSQVFVKDDEIDDSSWGEVLDFVLDEDLPEQMKADAARKRREAEAEQWEELMEGLRNEEPDTRVASGSTIDMLVAGAGFEPATSGL